MISITVCGGRTVVYTVVDAGAVYEGQQNMCSFLALRESCRLQIPTRAHLITDDLLKYIRTDGERMPSTDQIETMFVVAGQLIGANVIPVQGAQATSTHAVYIYHANLHFQALRPADLRDTFDAIRPINGEEAAIYESSAMALLQALRELEAVLKHQCKFF